jgi:hypothetical protein
MLATAIPAPKPASLGMIAAAMGNGCGIVVQGPGGKEPSFEAVLKSNPGYADAHCLYAVANGRFYPEPDLELAKREAQACLDNNPPTEMRGLVEQFLTSLQDATTTTTG